MGDTTQANDLHFTPTGKLKQGTKYTDLTTGEVTRPTTIKTVYDPVTQRTLKPRTLLRNIQQNPQPYELYVRQQQMKAQQQGSEWMQGFNAENNGMPLSQRHNFGVNDIRYADLPGKKDIATQINISENHEFDDRLTFGEGQIRARADRLGIPFEVFNEKLWKNTFLTNSVLNNFQAIW